MQNFVENLMVSCRWLSEIEVIASKPEDHNVICKAIDTRCGSRGELVAIKCLKRGMFLWKYHKYVRREVLAHRELYHRHVVQLRQVFLTGSHLCLLCDYGGDHTVHKQVVMCGHLCEGVARWYFQQMVLAVDYLHKVGYLNRDIKLANFLVDACSEHPVVKMCDLGFAKPLTHASPPITDLGTTAYKAPEVCIGQEYGKPADMWSLGICLFFMLCGVDFTFEDFNCVPEKLPRQKIPKDVSVTEDAFDLVKGLLKINPSKRMTMDELLARPWFVQDLPEKCKTYNECMLNPHHRDEILKRLQDKGEVLCMIEDSKFIPAGTSVGHLGESKMSVH